jgi:sacsin
LWKDSKLTDVTFVAGGERVSAHRLVLAAASQKYESLFAGAWANSPDMSKPIALEDISHATLLLMLDFAYHGQLDFQPLQAQGRDNSDVLADKLDGLLDLLAGADEWLMPRLHAEVEHQIMSSVRLYARPDNVRYILRIAEKTNAKELAKYCQKYCDVNSKTMKVVDKMKPWA